MDQSRGVAIITGASRGIGKAVAIDLAKEHFSLALVGREESLLKEVATLCESEGVTAKCYVYDLSKLEGINDLVTQIHQDLGGINILVNNAGVWIEKPIADASLAEWERTLDVNVRSVFALTKQALPYIEERGWGAVINISSLAGQRTYPGGTMYCASKHALEGFSGALFHDVREKGVKVCAISPGVANTDMHKDDERYDNERMIQPEDIAKAVSFVANFPDTACPTEITIMPQRAPEKSRRT